MGKESRRERTSRGIDMETNYNAPDDPSVVLLPLGSLPTISRSRRIFILVIRSSFLLSFLLTFS